MLGLRHRGIVFNFCSQKECSGVCSDDDECARRCCLLFRWNATLLTIALSCAAFSRDLKEKVRSFPLDSSQGLVAVGGDVKAVTYRGQRAVQLTPTPGRMEADGDMVAILTGSDFHDGTIEIKVAG